MWTPLRPEEAKRIERRLLGIMLASPETIPRVSAILGKGPEPFARHGHSEIYRVMLELGGAVDTEMIVGRLSDEATRSLERPVSYIEACRDQAFGYGTSGQAEHHARLLRSSQHTRQALHLCRTVSANLESGDDPGNILADLATQLDMARAGDTRITPVTMAELRRLHLQPPDPILGRGILSRGDWALIHARENHGKTWAILELAACLATGRPWFGIEVPRRFRVGIFSLEMGRYFAFSRLDPIMLNLVDWEKDSDLAEAEEWIYWLTKDEAPFLDILAPATQTWLCDWAATNKIDVIILDPLAQFFRGEETREGMAPLIEFLTTFPSRSGGCTPIVSHHDRKASQNGDTSDHASAARGSVAFIGSARCSFHLVLKDTERKLVELTCDKASNAPKPDPIWLRHESDGRLVLAQAPQSRAQEAIERVIQYLKDNPDAPAEGVGGAAYRTPEWARATLKKLEKDERVCCRRVKRTDGRGWITLWSLDLRGTTEETTNSSGNTSSVEGNAITDNYIDPF